MLRGVFWRVTAMLIMVLMVQSCAMEKRRYRPGWHISFHGLNKGAQQKEKPDENIEDCFIAEKETKINPPLLQPPEVTTEENPSLEKRLDKFQAEIPQNFQKSAGQVRGMQENKATLRKPELRQWEGKRSARVKPGAQKFWGGLLGVLLALVAIPVLFVLVLFSADSESFEISESSGDTAFVRAFKNTYNVVMRVGVIVMLWLVLLFFLVGFCVVIYLEVGVLGVILVVLLLVLILLLLSFVLDGFLEFLFPGITR